MGKNNFPEVCGGDEQPGKDQNGEGFRQPDWQQFGQSTAFAEPQSLLSTLFILEFFIFITNSIS